MVNSVKSGRKIKKTQTSDLLLTHGSDNVVVYSKYSGFSRVEFGVADWKEFMRLFSLRWSASRFLTSRSVSLDR